MEEKEESLSEKREEERIKQPIPCDCEVCVKRRILGMPRMGKTQLPSEMKEEKLKRRLDELALEIGRDRLLEILKELEVEES